MSAARPHDHNRLWSWTGWNPTSRVGGNTIKGRVQVRIENCHG